MPDVLFISTDLMFSSRVSGAAQRSGVTLRSTASLDAASLQPTDRNDAPRLVICDLSTSGLDIAAAVAACRAVELPPRIVAYAPHVHEAKLQAARAAECDAVYTKGQFDAQLDTILASAKAN